MTTLSEKRELILETFYTTWLDRTSIAWEDYDFDPSGQTEWVRITVSPNDGFQAIPGPAGVRYFKNTGLISVQVFTSINQDKSINDGHAQTALEIFYNKVANIRFYNQRISDVGRDGAFYQQNVIVEYEYYDFK